MIDLRRHRLGSRIVGFDQAVQRRRTAPAAGDFGLSHTAVTSARFVADSTDGIRALRSPAPSPRRTCAAAPARPYPRDTPLPRPTTPGRRPAERPPGTDVRVWHVCCPGLVPPRGTNAAGRRSRRRPTASGRTSPPAAAPSPAAKSGLSGQQSAGQVSKREFPNRPSPRGSAPVEDAGGRSQPGDRPRPRVSPVDQSSTPNRRGSNMSIGWRVAPSVTRSARISPITGTNLNPCPEKPHARVTRS
ncbi:hypothetical protein UA75_11425 [Actinoalloteichus sp. GBA129-24]|nr:hypothetical protein UA75_11425 [Actinoalloteichus sp. GBA129-24]